MKNKKQIGEDGIARILSPIAIHFAAKMREVMDAKGISRLELSRRTGVSRMFLWQIEDGRSEPSLTNAKKIATGLEVKLYDMLPGAETASLEDLPVENQPKEEE